MTDLPTAAAGLPRVQLVANTDAAPYHSICYLWISRRRGLLTTSSYTSSAMLIGDRHLLTAAHNVHGTPLTWVRKSETVCEVDTPREWRLRGAFGRRDIHVAPGYGWGNFGRDYAVVELSHASPRRSHFRLPRRDEQLLTPGTVVHVAGFPAAEGFQSRKLYHGSGAVQRVETSTFPYAVDTGGGMSGCPVWVEQSSPEGTEYVIVGVHVGFSGGFAIARRADEAALLDHVARWTGA